MRRLFAIVICCLACAACKKDDPFLVNNDPNEGGPPIGQDGSACSSDKRCDGGVCFTVTQGWRGGYCSTLECAATSCNGDDSECIGFLDNSSFCLDGCNTTADCRRGYRCRALDATGRSVCFRDAGDGPTTGSIGAECTADDDCAGDRVCDTAAPGGYCVQQSCGPTCPEESICADWNGGSQCVDACGATRDCRPGYVCDGFCKPGEPVEPPFPFETTIDVLDITCGGENLGADGFGTRWKVDYEVPDAATGYMLVPFVRTGALRPMEMHLPSGDVIDLVSDYKHHNIRVTEFQFFDQESVGVYGEVALDWPILVPYSPDRTDVMAVGPHSLELVTSVAEPCLYVMATTGGTRVDLNIIFVGLQGYSAAMGPLDPDLTEVFEGVNTILGTVGVGLGDVRFSDAPREIAERYAFVRDAVDLRRATAFGTPRDETLDGHLSVDMFLVEDMKLGGAPVLGLSAGLPGPPGLHGNAANGLVFTGADLGSDNPFVAHIMAHELGHYLGLRHTTEVFHNNEQGVELNFLLGTTDPIDDTPVCDSVLALQAACPDATNLMFPSAPAESFTAIITAGQGTVLMTNPTLKFGE